MKEAKAKKHKLRCLLKKFWRTDRQTTQLTKVYQMKKKCVKCGKEFETDAPWRICDECYKAYIEEKESRLKKCEICGKEFLPYRPNNRYCSPECRKEQKKQFQQEHRKECYERHRQWRKKHPERIKEYTRRDLKRRERQKQYRAAHKEELKAYNRTYYQNHKEEFHDYSKRRWREKKIKACKAKHDNCFSCPTKDGECLFE